MNKCTNLWSLYHIKIETMVAAMTFTEIMNQHLKYNPHKVQNVLLQHFNALSILINLYFIKIVDPIVINCNLLPYSTNKRKKCVISLEEFELVKAFADLNVCAQ